METTEYKKKTLRSKNEFEKHFFPKAYKARTEKEKNDFTLGVSMAKETISKIRREFEQTLRIS